MWKWKLEHESRSCIRKNLWRFWYKEQEWQTQKWWVTSHWASSLDWVNILIIFKWNYFHCIGTTYYKGNKIQREQKKKEWMQMQCERWEWTKISHHCLSLELWSYSSGNHRWGFKHLLYISLKTSLFNISLSLTTVHCPLRLNTTRKKGRNIKLTLDNYSVWSGRGSRRSQINRDMFMHLRKRSINTTHLTSLFPHTTKWTWPGSGFWNKTITSSVVLSCSWTYERPKYLVSMPNSITALAN